MSAAAVVHPPRESPIATEDVEAGAVLLDALLAGPEATVADLFAVLRQWEPYTQERVGDILAAMLARGAGVNDRDGLTDNTLLHYACKSGASGLGSTAGSAAAVAELVSRGADCNVRSNWTDMTPLHTAAFFGFGAGIEALLRSANPVKVNLPCREFDGATALHMAAMAGSEAGVNALVGYGANPGVKDANRRTPLDCAKAVASSMSGAGSSAGATWDRLIAILAESGPSKSSARGAAGPGAKSTLTPDQFQAANRRNPTGARTGIPRTSPVRAPTASKTAKTPVRSSGRSDPSSRIPTSGSKRRADKFGVGSRVFVDGNVGVVQHLGTTEFSAGTWVGVVFDEPLGKNDGTVAKKRYFTCAPRHGLFVRPNRATWRGINVANVLAEE